LSSPTICIDVKTYTAPRYIWITKGHFTQRQGFNKAFKTLAIIELKMTTSRANAEMTLAGQETQCFFIPTADRIPNLLG
jgi:hypothetical protein